MSVLGEKEFSYKKTCNAYEFACLDSKIKWSVSKNKDYIFSKDFSQIFIRDAGTI